VRLVSKDGDVIWSATEESFRREQFRGASADVAERITRQLSATTNAPGGHRATRVSSDAGGPKSAEMVEEDEIEARERPDAPALGVVKRPRGAELPNRPAALEYAK